ncbi:MAG TPA: hypothetical protein VOA41_11175 [Candidatus Dormibacteraeota bacterium]|nr:hypothetical protein [Candidatus Dormibacteraeota bacterium]
MPREGGLTEDVASESCVEKLAQFFPRARPVRIQVKVLAPGLGARRFVETSVVEFATSKEALFASTLPLEFDDHVRVEEIDGALIAEASVVAVQYHQSRKAVAVRFLTAPRHWILEP